MRKLTPNLYDVQYYCEGEGEKWKVRVQCLYSKVTLSGWSRCAEERLCGEVSPQRPVNAASLEPGRPASLFHFILRRSSDRQQPPVIPLSINRNTGGRWSRSAQSTRGYRRAGNGVRACTLPEFLRSTNNCCTSLNHLVGAAPLTAIA